MGLRIHSNLASVNAQRALSRSSSGVNTSVERLSSGVRINSARDDSAGVAISERMNAQVRGLQQAVRNANDAISLTKTAEGAMSETSANLQRLRELAVQSANGTLTASDRSAISLEAQQLIGQMESISKDTLFNGQTLFDGSFQSKVFQIGVQQGQTLNFDLDLMSTQSMGRTAEVVAANTASDFLFVGDLTINGVGVGDPVFGDDPVSVFGPKASTLAKFEQISRIAEQANVQVENLGTTVLGGKLAGGPLVAGHLQINGVAIKGIDVAVQDSTGTLRDTINLESNETGVVATLHEVTGDLVLTAEDGRNITIQLTPIAAAITGLTQGHNYGSLKLTSDDEIVIGGTNPGHAGFAAGSYGDNVGIDLTSLSWSTQSGASDAIHTVDLAIRAVSSVRADLGATMNRLESTISSQQVAAENISSALSQIRDVDVASEVAVLGREQVLRQAAVAILSQANVEGRVALDLLRS